LDHVLGIADAAEHPEGQVEHVGPVLPPCLGEIGIESSGRRWLLIVIHVGLLLVGLLS
jgi:hypothetical protein